MKSLTDISTFFRSQLKPQGFTQVRLEKEAGVAHQTVSNVLGGSKDYKVSTLLTVADRLGYEMVFVPKAAARGLAQGGDGPVVKSRVQGALSRINSGGGKEEI